MNLHYEIELALIIGKKITDLDPNDEKTALDSIDSKLLDPSGKACCLMFFANQSRQAMLCQST